MRRTFTQKAKLRNKQKMITLIGTGHVFNLKDALIDIFEEKQPDILCVELDKQRFNALMMKKNNPEGYEKAQKNLPIIYKLLSRFQESMAKEYGVTAGEEMITTFDYAKSHQKPVAFIDMNAQNLFQRMLKQMSLMEKIRMMFSGFAGLFVSKKRVEKELDNIEGNFDTYMDQIGEKFPTIKKVLIDDRNNYMANQLKLARESHEKIIAVIGDGHVPGISKLLQEKDLEFETIRLSQLRNKKSSEKDSSSASFSTEYKEL